MNLYKIVFLWIIGFISIFSFSIYAQSWGTNNSWNTYSSSKRANNPIRILDNLGQDMNEDYRIHDNAFNDINPNQWQYPSQYRIANAFDALRIQIAPYLQWIMYIGLSLAVIGIIYNGFLMVTKPVGADGDNAQVKKRLMNIVKWVFLLTGFYVIIQFILSIISYILQ